MPKSSKSRSLPARYEVGFLRDLDQRTELFQRLNAVYQAIIDDAGGAANLSHVKLALIERFVFLEATLQSCELEIATDPKRADELLGKWIQGVNSLQGIAKTIGLERRLSRTANLKAYVEARSS
jgi:hypothetical protein